MNECQQESSVAICVSALTNSLVVKAQTRRNPVWAGKTIVATVVVALCCQSLAPVAQESIILSQNEENVINSPSRICKIAETRVTIVNSSYKLLLDW